MGQSRPLFVYFLPFLITISIIQIEKSVDGVPGIQTRGRRNVGTDETSELCKIIGLTIILNYTVIMVNIILSIALTKYAMQDIFYE